MENVNLLVEVKVKDEFIEPVYTFMKALHKLTHELDEGCLQYDLLQSKDDKSKIFFIEKWENQDYLDRHMQKEHFKNFNEFTKDKIEDSKINFIDKYEE